ncbi:MAG: hypothetical protein JWN96_3002 [Mycobacterium sp.]|nr:hypothetical protein [Mycobacterium sp.]
MSDYPQLIVPVGHVEPVPRRIRAFRGNTLVLDTIRAMYVWERPQYPQYFVPLADVNQSALGKATPRTRDDIPQLAGLVRFAWGAFDRWFEEDEEVFVHPRNPYARVDALRSNRPVRVELEGLVLAESASPIMVFETGLPTRYYLDKTAVNFDVLVASDTTTGCPYKGQTTGYWSVRLGEQIVPDLAWCYDFPTRQLLPIAGLVAFYNEKVDISVDGVRLPRPQTHFS